MDKETYSLHRLMAYTDLTDCELLHLARLTRPVRRLARKTVIVEEGADTPHCFLLLDGWVGSFSTSREGRRTMTRIYMPGDLLASTSIAFRECTETLVALCPCAIASITARSIAALFNEHPRLASLVYLVAQEERVRQMDWVSSLLRLDAAGRIAALFLDLFTRHHAVHEQTDQSFPLHLSQHDIADLTGLTATHTNRVIQQFRHEQLIELQNHCLTIKDKERLEELSDRPRREIIKNPPWLPTSQRG